MNAGRMDSAKALSEYVRLREEARRAAAFVDSATIVAAARARWEGIGDDGELISSWEAR